VQNELIKFRVRADEKQILSEAVGKAGMTLSKMLRRTGRAAAAGRIAPRAVHRFGLDPDGSKQAGIARKCFRG